MVMDELMEGPGSVTELVATLGIGKSTVRLCCQRLVSEGLIEAYMQVPHTNKALITIYRMACTKKQDYGTELGRAAA